MPIVYICKICNYREGVQVLLDDNGEKRLMPPYRWRAVIFEDDDGDPDVLCPKCGEIYENAEPPKKSAHPFEILDGGKID